MTRLATVLGVTTGTATSMVKKLAAAKLAKYERFGGVCLTTQGTKAALDILRRHRIIETFLVETLKLDWSLVHDEAERLEHAISPIVLEALDRHLGHPSTDPHGDPIPGPDGRVREPAGTPLSACAAGSQVRIARIADQAEAFLLFAARHGLKPGAEVKVMSVDAAAQAITVQSGQERPITLALAAASAIIAEAPAQ